MTVEEFIKNDDYFDKYEERIKYKEYTVYRIWREEDKDACLGYPDYLLVNEENIRIADFSEVVEIMAILSNKKN